MLKSLPGNAGAERQVHLERYLHAWLTTHALALSDLTRSDVRDRLLKTLSADLGAILGKSVETIAMHIGAGAMKAAAAGLQRGVSKLLSLGSDTKRGGR